MAAVIVVLCIVYVIGVAWWMWKAGAIQESKILDDHDPKDKGAD